MLSCVCVSRCFSFLTRLCVRLRLCVCWCGCAPRADRDFLLGFNKRRAERKKLGALMTKKKEQKQRSEARRQVCSSVSLFCFSLHRRAALRLCWWRCVL